MIYSGPSVFPNSTEVRRQHQYPFPRPPSHDSTCNKHCEFNRVLYGFEFNRCPPPSSGRIRWTSCSRFVKSGTASFGVTLKQQRLTRGLTPRANVPTAMLPPTVHHPSSDRVSWKIITFIRQSQSPVSWRALEIASSSPRCRARNRKSILGVRDQTCSELQATEAVLIETNSTAIGGRSLCLSV